MEIKIASLIDEITASLQGGQSSIRLGVTGLSRAGKTVFITSLVSNLLERDRMAHLQAETQNRISATRLDEQPDQTLARFEYEKHLKALLADTPNWPESTRHISEIRLSFRVERTGFSQLLGDNKTVHLDIVDYPGEWLLDLALINKSYRQWSKEILERFKTSNDNFEAEYFKALESLDPKRKLAEPESSALAESFRQVALARHKAGINDAVPGRFLLPAELEGAPAITFAALSENFHGKPLARLFESRFEAYKRQVVRPFFRNHFAKLDRQVVLVDVLGALEKGPEALRSLESAMADILSAFRVGKSGFFDFILGARISKIAFVATKADLVHHYFHEKLVDLTREVLKKAENRSEYTGARTAAKAVASMRATVEDETKHEGQNLAIVRGIRERDRKSVGFYFGDLPDDPERFLLGGAAGEFNAPKLAPPNLTKRSKKGLPHIRMDQLAEFLIGDYLR